MAEMPSRLRERYQEQAADFLEPGEQVEWGIQGQPGGFGGWLRNSMPWVRPTLRLILTDRSVYMLKLGGSGVVKERTPSEVLSKRDRTGVSASYKAVPPTLTVGEETISPDTQSAGRCKAIVDALSTSPVTATAKAPTA